MSEERPRLLSGWLLLGMLTAPGLACWLLLRRGYSRSLRQAGFVYAGTFMLIGLVGKAFG